MYNFTERQWMHMDAQDWFVGSADIKNAFRQMHIPRWLQPYFALPAVLASEVDYRGKTDTSGSCFLGDVFVNMSRNTARSREVLMLLFSYVVTTPLHRCSVANMAWDPLAPVGRMLRISGSWLAALTAPTFILHVSFAGVQKAGLDVHDISNSISRRYDLFAPSYQRSGSGARQWSRVFPGAHKSRSSLNS